MSDANNRNFVVGTKKFLHQDNGLVDKIMLLKTTLTASNLRMTINSTTKRKGRSLSSKCLWTCRAMVQTWWSTCSPTVTYKIFGLYLIMWSASRNGQQWLAMFTKRDNVRSWWLLYVTCNQRMPRRRNCSGNNKMEWWWTMEIRTSKALLQTTLELSDMRFERCMGMIMSTKE